MSDNGNSPKAERLVDGKGGLKPDATTMVRVAAYFGNFGLAKATAYLAPLALAAKFDSTTYGVVEFAWSWSALLATLLTLGVPGAIPQLSLLRRPIPVTDIAALCVVIPGTALTVAALIALSVADRPEHAVILGACTIALSQVTLTSYARTFSRRNLALWFEGLSIYGMTLIALGLGLTGLTGVFPLGIATTIISAILVLVAAILSAQLKQPELAIRLRSAVRTGLPLLAFTLASIWASVCGRVYIGGFLSVDDLSVYAVDFRLGSALLIVHSVVATGLFARLYRMRSRLYDRFLSLYLAAIAIVAVAMTALFPLVINHVHFHSLRTNNIDAAVSLFPVVMLQVYAWGAWASLELRLARTGRSASAARRTIGWMAAIAMLLLGLGLQGLLSLWLCTALVALQMLGGVAIQLLTLWRRGAKMPRTIAAISFGTALISLCCWIIHIR